MRTSDINSILSSFFNNKNYRAILIDGKWGIGKTYQFKKYFDSLKKKDKKRIFYFTIFGTETMEELNTRIYRKLHPFWSFIKVGYKTISQSVDAVVGLKNSSLNISANLDYVLYLAEPQKIKTIPVLIFDDIERFADNNFSLFLGLLYKLNLQGTRIICLTSSEKLHDKEVLFNEYKEKIFDAIYKIDEPSDDVFRTIFTGLDNLDQREYILGKCNKNIRILRKAELLYKRLISEIGKPNTWIINELNVIVACCFTIRIVLDSSRENDDCKIDKTTSKYFCLKKEFDENIASNYMALIEEEKFTSTEDMIPNLIMRILKVYLFNDFSGVKMMLLKRKEREKTLLEKNFFLLSDDNKEEYVSSFSKFIADPSTKYDKEYLTILENIILYYHGSIEPTLIDNFVSKYYESSNKNEEMDQPELVSWLQDLKSAISDINVKNKIDNVLSEVIKKLFELQADYNTNKLLNGIRDNNEVVIDDYIRRFDSLKKWLKQDLLKKFLISNNYCLPNLSGDISESDWRFSREMAALVHLLNLDESFIDHAKDLIKNDPSHSLKYRLQTLIQYKLFKQVDLTQQ